MKKVYGVVTYAIFALMFTFSQVGAAAADNAGEKAEIASAMKLYAEALPMELNSPKKGELLDQAAVILTKVIEKNPKSLDAHRKLMGVYVLKQDYSNGIRTMQDAITLSPEDPKLFVTLAFLYEHSGALDYAKAMLDQALSLDPNQTLAKDYKMVIQQKIDQRNTMEQAHNGKSVMGAGHGQPMGSGHPPIDPKK